jgi:beta-galactosidase
MTKSNIEVASTLAGLLLFLAGFLIFMGIITGEIYYPLEFNTRDNYISELAAAFPPATITPQPSAIIFNLTMMVSGIMIIIAAFSIQITFRKLLSSIPLGLVGIGILGVGIFPGNVVPWHGIFALIIFIAGGIGAITSFKIVASPIRYVFICLGIIALVFLLGAKIFIPTLGVGGAERWLFYPIVFWLTGLGAYLSGLKRASDIRLAFIGMVLITLGSCNKPGKMAEIQSFNNGWDFVRIDSTLPAAVPIGEIPDSCWEDITLPHTAVIEPLVIEGQQWTGICWYRKNFQIGRENSGKHVGILIGAAMNSATVWLNGIEIKRHLGGYLPFYLDISNQINFGPVNTLLIRLDNSENPEIPPGKLLKELDFNYYSGLYRNVGLLIKDKLHFSNAMEIDSLQGGGIMVHTDKIAAETAGLSASVSIINQGEKVREFRIKGNLLDDEGKMAASVKSGLISIPPRSSIRIPLGLQVPEPKLWSPGFPFLYTLETELVEGGKVLETESCHIGIREIRMSATEGFTINGWPLKIRGTNRHQEYPYIGYALSDNAQYRDAWKIKQAGFNFVRSSHYPQSPAFLDACDELGILVMDAIPGWQFYGDSTFRRISYQNTREMCRRDRNHPSIILWEASLNETVMPVDFMQKSHEIVHAELPYKDIYTCGWMDTIYDVFIPARQHNVPPNYWNKYPKNKPLFIAEYGSWEYYAQNAGFNQTEFKDLKPADRSSRQLRGYGEIRLLQQAFNFMEAYNSNLSGPAIGSSNWVMYDYNRGYAPDIEPSGIMDIFRIPKFTWWFYKSQSDDEPVCFIASFHSPASAKYVRVFSNGDSVSLYRNGVLISARRPDKNSTTSNLGHPPFTFDMPPFDSGTLKAKAFKNGKVWADHSITTSGPAENLLVEADLSNRQLKADGGDVIFIYAKITDATGNILFDSGLPVHFTVTGDATLIGNNPAAAEGGIATILLKAGLHPGKIRVKAESKGLRSSELEVVSEQ